MPIPPDISCKMGMDNSRAGFVSLIGRPNSGKSTLLNILVDEKIALVSHKINATRKRMNIIVMYKDSQIIFVDTPGIHNREKMLNQFMLQESLKAIDDCDVVVFLAPIKDDLRYYQDFLALSNNKKHILLLTKIDMATKEEILEKMAKYKQFEDKYQALIPVSSLKHTNLDSLLDEITKCIPYSPYLYDTDIISTQNLREIYKEKIRESIFDNINKEIPYQSDVIIKKIEENENLDKVYAEIIVEKVSQKIIVVGKDGKSIKNIGINARKKIEAFSNKKIFLKLEVVVKKGWSKNKKMLKEIGYTI